MTSTAQALKAALAWHLDAGVDETLLESPQDYTVQKAASHKPAQTAAQKSEPSTSIAAQAKAAVQNTKTTNTDAAPLGASEARAKALALIKDITTLDELEKALADFDGLAIKNTATNMVFADGNPKARVMVIGEPPRVEEDLQGQPFVGQSGQLLDKIFGSIGLERTHEDPAQSFYISSLMNWRPPGNRGPSASELNISLPFIEKHIALVNPDILVLTGSMPAATLLNKKGALSQLRGKWHEYTPQTQEIGLKSPIPVIVTYHPADLLRTPAQKRAVWHDMLTLRAKLAELPEPEQT